MRVALKVAYDGTRFAGNQVQPGLRTVHGALVDAFAKLGFEAPRLRWAGRTDAGVSAAGNVVVAHVPRADDELLPALTYNLEDAWAWAWTEVPEDFEPRHARARRYRYHLRTALPPEALHEALALFVGAHDFSSFARVEPGVNPVRTVEGVDVARRGPFLVADVWGPNFIWNQVRRMVEAARRVAEGELPPAEVRAALRGGPLRDFGLAPPEPLVLLDVRYDAPAWRVAEGDLRARVFQRLARRVADAETRLAVMGSLLETQEAP